MNVKVTKLSESELSLLRDVYKQLQELKLPTSYRSKGGTNHGTKTGCNKQIRARQCCFGRVKFRDKIITTCITKKHPHIMPLFRRFMRKHRPHFRFKNVQVNKDCVCKKHKDKQNSGASIIVGVGPYTHGRTVLHLPEGKKSFNIRKNSLMFDGSKIFHESEPFHGTRYSFVFFR